MPGAAGADSEGSEAESSEAVTAGASAFAIESEAEGTPGVPSCEVISRKELARQLRRQAYQRAKAARAVDPKHLALKEANKQRRRDLYRRVKAERKTRDAEREVERKAAEAKQRAEAKRQLAERVKSVIGRASEPGRALARDIERALQSADVKELIEQLRAQSAALAAQHRDGAPPATQHFELEQLESGQLDPEQLASQQLESQQLPPLRLDARAARRLDDDSGG